MFWILIRIATTHFIITILYSSCVVIILGIFFSYLPIKTLWVFIWKCLIFLHNLMYELENYPKIIPKYVWDNYTPCLMKLWGVRCVGGGGGVVGGGVGEGYTIFSLFYLILHKQNCYGCSLEVPLIRTHNIIILWKTRENS